MKGWIRSSAVLLLAASGARAGDEFEIKLYQAGRADGAVLVDGRLDEECWRRALVVSAFTLYDRVEPADPQTSVQVTYDDTCLYVGVRCDEPRMDLVKPVPVMRDDKAVFRGEAVELFVDPVHSHSEYYQFGISAAGSVYDSRLQDRAWNAHVRAASHLDSSEWSVEVAIPWEDLGVDPAPGTLLGFNVCRDRQVERRQWSNWSQTREGFHDPVRFGHLLLGGKGALSPSLTAALRKGGREGPIRVYEAYGVSGISYRFLAEEAVGGLRARLDELEAAADSALSGRERQELEEGAASYEARLASLNRWISEKAPLDEFAWARMKLQVERMRAELETALWKARLEALLSRI